jgi:hypothetical protein
MFFRDQSARLSFPLSTVDTILYVQARPYEGAVARHHRWDVRTRCRPFLLLPGNSGAYPAIGKFENTLILAMRICDRVKLEKAR